jgi:predicted amidophosphoribosyltransferase
MEEQYARQLERELPTETFEAILSPPSRYDHAAVYRDAFIAALRARRELKDRFHKDGTSRSGEGADLAEIIGELKYEAHGDEASLRSVLIVDDTLGTGNTVSAVITRLLDAGVPASCRFAVAVPFWAKPL